MDDCLRLPKSIHMLFTCQRGVGALSMMAGM